MGLNIFMYCNTRKKE